MPGERAQVRRRPTPPWWDAAVAAGFLAFGSLLFAVDAAALDPSRGEQVPVLVRIAVLTLGCAAQVLRARRPAVALGVGVLAVGVLQGAGLLVPVFWGSEVRQHWEAAAAERANAAQATRIAELDRRAAVEADGPGWPATCMTSSPGTSPRSRSSPRR